MVFPEPHPRFPAWSRYLAPLSPAWGGVLRLRTSLYASGLLRSTRLSRPVISVGNLVLGGTGKTPCVAALAREAVRAGKRPCLLTRGYGRRGGGRVVVSRGEGALVGAAAGGDEPVLLAQRVPGLAVIVDADRAGAGRWAETELAPDLFLLDDGFQHLAVTRDRDLVLLDAADPLGGGGLPPVGLLREPADGLARATDVAVVVADGQSPDAALEVARRRAPGARTQVVRRRLLGPFDPKGREVPPLALAGRRLLALAGVARPEGVFASLRRLGLPVAAELAFPDHHLYGPDDFERIGRILDENRLDGVVTTGKDGVKLTPEVGFPWWWIDVEIEGAWGGILSVLGEWEVQG